MNELSEFLLARIAEDEEWLAQQSGDLEWCQECAFGQQPESPYSLSRLTAECEAKRRIVTEGFGRVHLEFLAAVYAGHPDYRDEWVLELD